MKCSPATVLRLVRQSPLPSSAHVRVVGVDERAWRKGQRYGTILVDLEQQIPIDLLADDTVSSFAGWLQAHPSVEIVSRDRGTTYADGATRGAPLALQVADAPSCRSERRFHLGRGVAIDRTIAPGMHHSSYGPFPGRASTASQARATLGGLHSRPRIV